VLARHQLPPKLSRLGYSAGVGFPPDWGERTISLRADDDTELKRNMVLHMIAGMWQEDHGYEVSEVVVVCGSGAGEEPELLCETDRRLFLCE
jgi:ectoine hydrolase